MAHLRMTNGWLTTVCRAFLGLALGLVIRSPAWSDAPIQLRDVTKETGITFQHTDGSSGQRYIVETVTGGLALFDYDRDGDEDIYFLNGAPLRGAKIGTAPVNALYRNDGDWKFTDVTEQAGVGDAGFGLGVAVADYDNDGDLDLYVNNYGPNRLYCNLGNGTFSDVTTQARVSNGNKVGAGACFLDVDRDGDLDLYVSSYVQFTYSNHRQPTVDGFPQYASPRSFDAWPDALFRNNGNGTFTDIGEESGIAAVAGTGMGMVCFDYDDDDDTDVFVCNDVSANFLFQNDGHGKFEEVGLTAGLSYNVYGKENGSMGVDCGDYNRDGRLDLIMTSYQGEFPVLYQNLGDGLFEDVTATTGAGRGAFPFVTWGTGFVDFDNDGNQDIFYACGHLQDNIDQMDDRTAYHARNLVLRNEGNGRFVNVNDQGGDGLDVMRSSRGAAFADLDNDGDIDAVIANSRQQPTILRNETNGGNHWLQLRLHGSKSNRDGVGARVRVVTGSLTQTKEVHSGRGYQSHFGLRLHFGLGRQETVDRVEVRWPQGGSSVLENVEADRLVDIYEEA